MSKPVPSNGKTQQALLDAFATPLSQPVADLLLVSINLRSCKRDALQTLQTAYQSQFGATNAELEKFVAVRNKQAGGTATTPASAVTTASSAVDAAPVADPSHLEVSSDEQFGNYDGNKKVVGHEHCTRYEGVE